MSLAKNDGVGEGNKIGEGLKSYYRAVFLVDSRNGLNLQRRGLEP